MDNMTAKVSCFARAYHYKHNSEAGRIFSDSIAAELLGEDYSRIAASMTEGIPFFMPDFKGTAQEGLRLIVDRQLSPSVLGRSAFCEEALEAEIKSGCRQYIVFASGYDTYSIRHCSGIPYCGDNDTSVNTNIDIRVNTPTGIPRVFELDLPEVTEDKARRIAEAGLKSKAVQVSCDLAKADWTDLLISRGYETGQKTFGSLLGISYYLQKQEWKNLLKTAAGILPGGSTICFDYPCEDEGKETKVNRKLAGGAGEEMKAAYSPRGMAKLLDECGFSIRKNLNPKEMTEQYFSRHNELNPGHPMATPNGVNYILADRDKSIQSMV